MTRYDVYVICDQCGQPHSVNVQIELENAGLDKTRLADHFSDSPAPPQVAFMQTNKYRCPHTKQLFAAADLNAAVLFAASASQA
ncbi:MAG: hypothetical protein ABJA02_09430 [Acidobacteriota bacterium]